MTLHGFTSEQVQVIRDVVRKVIFDEFLIADPDTHSRKTKEGQTKEGKLDGTLSVGGTATLSVWTGPSGTWADSGNNLTVSWPTGQGAEVDSGKYLRVVRINGEWRPATGVC